MAANTRCKETIDAFSPLLDSKQVKDLIKERGWSQKDIAEYWGMSQNWISTLIKNEGGQRGVRDDCAFMGLPRKK